MDGVNENALRVKLIEKKKVGSSRRGDDLARRYEGATRHGGEEEQGAGGEEKGRSGEEENCPKGEEGTWRQRNVICHWVVSLLQQAMPHRMDMAQKRASCAGTSECGSGEEKDSAAGRVRNPSHEFRRGSNYHYCVRITEMFKWASIP